MNLRTLNTELLENGGFSYSLTFGNVYGSDNYSVAFHKATENVFEKLPTEADYQEYVNKHITLLAREDFILGGWEHEGNYYLDVAQLLSKDEYSKEAAIKVGQEREQIAIFDLQIGEEIKCKEDTDKCYKCGTTVADAFEYCPNCMTQL
jgi:hypothetical protein